MGGRLFLIFCYTDITTYGVHLLRSFFAVSSNLGPNSIVRTCKTICCIIANCNRANPVARRGNLSLDLLKYLRIFHEFLGNWSSVYQNHSYWLGHINIYPIYIYIYRLYRIYIYIHIQHISFPKCRYNGSYVGVTFITSHHWVSDYIINEYYKVIMYVNGISRYELRRLCHEYL